MSDRSRTSQGQAPPSSPPSSGSGDSASKLVPERSLTDEQWDDLVYRVATIGGVKVANAWQEFGLPRPVFVSMLNSPGFLRKVEEYTRAFQYMPHHASHVKAQFDAARLGSKDARHTVDHRFMGYVAPGLNVQFNHLQLGGEQENPFMRQLKDAIAGDLASGE